MYQTRSMFALIIIVLASDFAKSYPTIDSLIVGSGQSLFDLIGYDSTQTMTLLYRGTRDGFDAATFHSLCDGYIQTLTIIQSTSSYIFGGYTGVGWSSANSYIMDADAFLFSLTNMYNNPVVIKNKPGDIYALYCGTTYGPTFGGAHDLHI